MILALTTGKAFGLFAIGFTLICLLVLWANI